MYAPSTRLLKGMSIPPRPPSLPHVHANEALDEKSSSSRFVGMFHFHCDLSCDGVFWVCLLGTLVYGEGDEVQKKSMTVLFTARLNFSEEVVNIWTH